MKIEFNTIERTSSLRKNTNFALVIDGKYVEEVIAFSLDRGLTIRGKPEKYIDLYEGYTVYKDGALLYTGKKQKEKSVEGIMKAIGLTRVVNKS